MTKKVKSFTADADVYDTLIRIFRDQGAYSSVSFFINKCLTELLEYLQNIHKEIGGSSDKTVPMKFVIDSMLGVPFIKMPDQSALKEEVEEWQRKYDESRSKDITIDVDPEVYKEIEPFGKQYNISDLIRFILKFIYEEAKKRRDLTDDEMDQIIRDMGGIEFRKQMKDKYFSKIEKINPDLRTLIDKFRSKKKER
jgi:hypothetical protein